MSETDAAAAVPVEAVPQAAVEDKTVEDKVVEDKPETKESKPDTNILKTTAKHDKENPQNNRKFDPSAREVSDDPVAIRKQVEFYFGDWNFPQDKFMWESCSGPENKPIPIEKIHSFKRMRTFQPYSAVVAALRDSTFLNVSGEEGKEAVSRKVPYKPMAANKAKSEAASAYVKGFGDETPNTQFDLESFFAQFGEVQGLKLRRTNEGLFKGSVFVTFADEEAAKKFLELDPAPMWKDHDLKIMSKHDYCEEKSDLIRQGKLEPSTTSFKKFYEGKDYGQSGSRGRGGRDRRGGRDPNDWKSRREHDQKNGFRGGRGRGRGGRGRGGRDNRDRRDNRENGEARRNTNDSNPNIKATDGEGDEATANGKRAREDNGAAEGEPAAKKVDNKEEQPQAAEASS